MKLLVVIPVAIVSTSITWQIVVGHQDSAFQKKEEQKWLLECTKHQEVDFVLLQYNEIHISITYVKLIEFSMYGPSMCEHPYNKLIAPKR